MVVDIITDEIRAIFWVSWLQMSPTATVKNHKQYQTLQKVLYKALNLFISKDTFPKLSMAHDVEERLNVSQIVINVPHE